MPLVAIDAHPGLLVTDVEAIIGCCRAGGKLADGARVWRAAPRCRSREGVLGAE